MSDNQDLEIMLEEAFDHYREDRMDQAKSLFDQMLEIDPTHLEALDWRGEIAIQDDEFEIAAECLQKAKDLDEAGFEEYGKLGLAYYELEESRKAVENLKTAINRNGEDLVAHSNLGRALYSFFRSGEQKEAAAIAREWVGRFPDNPDALHMGSAVGGLEPPEQAVEAYVADVFDIFAKNFDDRLAQIDYCAPQLLAGMVKSHRTDDKRPLDILDAGCGTGLCGPLLKPLAARLEGVDLSAGMLEKAAERLLYDELVEAELVSFLNERPGQYELVVAADVLIYFGDLEKVFAATLNVLRSGGRFSFSLEKDPCTENYELQPSGRYSHGQEYVLDTIQAAGFRIISYDQAVLRSEYGQEVNGLIVLAEKP